MAEIKELLGMGLVFRKLYPGPGDNQILWLEAQKGLPCVAAQNMVFRLADDFSEQLAERITGKVDFLEPSNDPYWIRLTGRYSDSDVLASSLGDVYFEPLTSSVFLTLRPETQIFFPRYPRITQMQEMEGFLADYAQIFLTPVQRRSENRPLPRSLLAR